MLPQSALSHEAQQDVITERARSRVARAWSGMRGRRWSVAWRDRVGPAVQTAVLEAQQATVTAADAYVPAVLAELGFRAEVPSVSNLSALIGVAGDGTPTGSLTYGAVTTAVEAMVDAQARELAESEAARQALDEAEAWLDQLVVTMLADTARAAETVATTQRTWVEGYVRMVEPGACSRCVILAGHFYKFNDGFDRHPKCRCRHIPASENVAGDLTTNPSVYFDSLTSAQQDTTFGKFGAAAIRLGVDPGQVVRARRGMQTAQVHGRKALITTEGTTARGLAGKSLGDLGKVAGQRYRRSKTPRLMPETILAEAKDPQDALRLLTRFGYVL